MLREIVFGVGLPLLLPLFWMGLDGIMFFMPGADILTGIAAVIVIVRICRDLNGPEEEEVRYDEKHHHHQP